MLLENVSQGTGYRGAVHFSNMTIFIISNKINFNNFKEDVF